MHVNHIVKAIKTKGKAGLGLLLAVPVLLILAPLALFLLATAAVASLGIAVLLHKFGKQPRRPIEYYQSTTHKPEGGRVIEGSYEVV